MRELRSENGIHWRRLWQFDVPGSKGKRQDAVASLQPAGFAMTARLYLKVSNLPRNLLRLQRILWFANFLRCTSLFVVQNPIPHDSFGIKQSRCRYTAVSPFIVMSSSNFIIAEREESGYDSSYVIVFSL